jgi:hypothetical protein
VDDITRLGLGHYVENVTMLQVAFGTENAKRGCRFVTRFKCARWAVWALMYNLPRMQQRLKTGETKFTKSVAVFELLKKWQLDNKPEGPLPEPPALALQRAADWLAFMGKNEEVQEHDLLEVSL